MRFGVRQDPDLSLVTGTSEGAGRPEPWGISGTADVGRRDYISSLL